MWLKLNTKNGNEVRVNMDRVHCYGAITDNAAHKHKVDKGTVSVDFPDGSLILVTETANEIDAMINPYK